MPKDAKINPPVHDGGLLPSHHLTSRAGFWVSVLSVSFVMGLLFYLFYSAYLQSQQFPIQKATEQTDLAAAIHPSQLEMQYQNLKAVRFSYALIYRFSLSIAAIVVSLATIVLGSVLIFDRIREEIRQEVLVEYGVFKASLLTTFPGLLMVFLGSLTLTAAMILAGPLSPNISVLDVPVFVVDQNHERRSASYLGVNEPSRSFSAVAATGTSAIDLLSTAPEPLSQ